MDRPTDADLPTDTELLARARDLLALCLGRGIVLATAESCTGGLLAATLTAIEGSSAVVDRGFVTYSNAAKTGVLGVPPDLIATHGAVSGPCASAMADGALARSDADIALAITGIAGPGGGSAAKPVGLVHFALAARTGGPRRHHCIIPGDRAAVRRGAVMIALGLIAGSAGASGAHIVGNDALDD